MEWMGGKWQWKKGDWEKERVISKEAEEEREKET